MEASSVHKHIYSNWRALCGVHLDDGVDDRKAPEAATAQAAGGGSTLDTGSTGVGWCSGIVAGKALRRQRRNGLRRFQVEAELKEVDVVAEDDFACFRAFSGHLLRYFRCSP